MNGRERAKYLAYRIPVLRRAMTPSYPYKINPSQLATMVELKREHAHVHLGFADNQVQGWLKSAGLNVLEPIHFPGRRLMTGIWRAERELVQRPALAADHSHGVPR